MFAPLFRSTPEKKKKKEIDNTRRFLYNAGRNSGVALSRANRQLQHTSQIKVSRGTNRKEVKDEPTK